MMNTKNKIKMTAGGALSSLALMTGHLVAGDGTANYFDTKPAIDYADLRAGFSDVPQHAKMRTWWFWLEGLATKDSITKDLEAMKAKGIGGALVIDNGASNYAPSGPVFMSEAWQELFAHVIAESSRLGIEISLNIQSGAGDPGNPNIANDNGLKRMVHSETQVSGPGKIERALPMPPHNRIFYQDVAVQAVRKPSRPEGAASEPQWIWSHSEDWATAAKGSRHFRRMIELDSEPLRGAEILITADNACTLWINGREVLKDDNWKTPTKASIKPYLRPGKNVVAVEVVNTGRGAAGLIAWLTLTDQKGKVRKIGTDEAWTSGPAGNDWRSSPDELSGWRSASVIGSASMSPWKLAGVFPGAKPANPIKNFSIKSFNKNSHNARDYYAAHEDAGAETAIAPNQVVDLSAHFKDGTLSWDAPAGDWTIIRYGMTSTGKRNNYGSAGFRGGLCYDPMNERGIRAQFEDVAQPLIEIASKNGDSLKFLHTDSWEMKMCNWTQGFREAFERRRGYAMDPYLPVLAGRLVGDRERSNRFLEDFRLTVADLIAEENYAVFKQLAHDRGLALHSESAGPHQPPLDGLRTLGINDIPMGESWARSNTHRTQESRRIQVSLAASASHIYGKRFVAAESPTTVGPIWERSPAEVKNVLDKSFCYGVNRINWHTYTSSPDEFGLPGIAYFAGTQLNRNVTWWEESEAFIGYINRTQHMLSQGLHVADVLGYLGSRAPLFAILPHLERNDVPDGYTWDMCNADAFLSRASVRDGRIVLADGKSYALFALSDDRQMHLPVLQKIEQLVRDGMILVGNPPQRPFGLTGYPESDAAFDALVRKLWPQAGGNKSGVHAYGKGKVYAGMGVDAVLEREKIGPDFTWTPKEGVDLRYIHFTSGEVDVYYVVNQWARHGIEDLNYRYFTDLPDRFVQVEASFRVDGERSVERWDPVSGKITPVHVYRREGGYHTLPIGLEPEGGAFYVFRKTGKTDRARQFTRLSKDGAEVAGGNTPLEVGASRVFVGNDRLETLDPGRFELTTATGKTLQIDRAAAAKTLALAGPWQVAFLERPSLGEPFSAEFDTLRSWTESSIRAIKYFSGTARYTRTFNLSDPSALDGGAYLDLGMVGDIATVRLNGKEVGIYWQAPYIADLSGHLVEGENQLEVEVTNLWINRLIGDEKLPQAERKTSTNLRKHGIYGKLRKPDADRYLRVSGLIGPVEIRFSKMHDLPK